MIAATAKDEVGGWSIEAIWRDGDGWKVEIMNQDGRSYYVTDNTRGEAEHYARQLMELDSRQELTENGMDVALFMLKAKQPLSGQPHVPPKELLKLRCELLIEETLEFIEACGFSLIGVESDALDDESPALAKRYGREIVPNGRPADYEGMIDACADVGYVNTGNILTLGAGDADVQVKVALANLAKFTGNYGYSPTGKLIKPTGWKKPVYEAVEQFNAAAEGIEDCE